MAHHSKIYTPKKEEEYIAPFGPVMGYKKMTPTFLRKMNELMNPDLEDWSDKLVGKVKQELKFSKEIEQLWHNEFAQFIGRFHNYVEYRHSFGETKLDIENFNHGIQIASGWFVRQFENEYNPLHIHTGARMSCVGYLKLPKDFGKNFQQTKKVNYNGSINFIDGRRSFNSPSVHTVAPVIGDFYIFPSYLLHSVNPYYGEGERRSLSFNANIDEKIVLL